MRTLLRQLLWEYGTRRGFLGPVRLVVKGFALATHWRAHRAWLRCIGGPVTGALLIARPRMAFRPYAKYLFAGPDLATRMRYLSTHYAFLNDVCTEHRFALIMQGRGLPIWRARDGATCAAIHLVGPPEHHEGDLALHFLLDDVVIFHLAFSIIPADFCGSATAAAGSQAAHCLYIGQVQGVVGEVERIRQATRLCEAIAPQDLLMNALAGIAGAWGIRRMVGVSTALHIARGKMASSSHSFRYEDFWARYQSSMEGRHHVIEVPFRQRSIADIVHRHRKRTLRKRTVKQGLIETVAAHLVDGPSARAPSPLCGSPAVTRDACRPSASASVRPS